MPLIKPVEELLKQIADEGDRKALQANFEKYDFLQKSVEGNLRQQDYDRQMNETKAEKEAAEKAKQANLDWYNRNKTRYDEMVKNYAELETKNKTLEEQVREAAEKASAGAGAGGGGGEAKVDQAEILKRVNEEIAKRGYVSQSDAQKIVEEQTKKQVEEQAKVLRDNFYKTDVPGVIAFVTSLNDLQYMHRDEFKKPLNHIAFSKFMAEEKIDDPMKAYDRFVAEERTKLMTEKIKADAKAEAEKEFASKYNLPGSGAIAAPELGPLQLERSKKTTYIPESAVPGDNQLAYAAAAELRSEGKF